MHSLGKKDDEWLFKKIWQDNLTNALAAREIMF